MRRRHAATACRVLKNYEKRPTRTTNRFWMGVDEYMRQNPTRRPEQCLAGPYLTDADCDKRFLAGNMSKHGNSFMVVGILRFKTSRQYQLLDDVPMAEHALGFIAQEGHVFGARLPF